MNEIQERQLLETAQRTERLARREWRWAQAALGVLAVLLPTLWWLTQRAAAEAVGERVAPLVDRVAQHEVRNALQDARLLAAEAQIDAIQASADAQAIAAEQVARDVESVRRVVETLDERLGRRAVRRRRRED